MAAALRASGLDAPTDVQRRVWPCCLLGRDTVGVAPTGSGKTLGYALPLAELLSSWEPPRSASPRSASPLALVLVPTRELCQQAARAMERALSSAAGGVRVLALHGGEARSEQRAALANATAPLHVVVATPGRLLDLAGAGSLSSGGGDVSGVGAGNEGIGMGGGSIFSSTTTTTGRGAPPMSNPSTAAVDLSSVRYVVFDEADKLLTSADLAEQCCRLHALTHPQRQTLLFTATLAVGLPGAAAPLVRQPLVVRASSGHAAAVGSAPGADDSKLSARTAAAAAAGTAAAGTAAAGTAASAARKLEEWEDDEGEEGEWEEAGEAGDGLGADLEVPRCIRQEVSVCAEQKKPRRLMKLLQKLQGGDQGGEATRAVDGGQGAQGATGYSKGGGGGGDRSRGQQSGTGDGTDAGAPHASSGGPDRRVLIFANKIKAVSFIATLLVRHGFAATHLSSRLSQHERERTLRHFAQGRIRILVATDVAARGVHIDGLRYVINWDFGTNLAQYVHRVGRTGRQGQPGTAYSFFSRQLRPLAPAAVALLEAHEQPVDQYLRALADEAAAEGGQEAETAGADEANHPNGDVEARAAKSRAGGGGGKQAGRSDDDDDSDAGDGSAQRWLAARLVSPITGIAPAFGAGALASWGKRKKDGQSEDEEAEETELEGALRPAKKNKKKKKKKKKKKGKNGEA